MSHPEGQGHVESQVNRLIERCGYGRSGFDLLRIRVLLATWRAQLEPRKRRRIRPPPALTARPARAHDRRPNTAMLHRPNAHATISGNSARHSAWPCDATRSLITTSAPAVAQRDRPPGRVLEEERLQRAGDEVRARNPTRQHTSRFVPRARRAGEDRTIDVRMAQPKGERELSTRRDTEHCGAFGGQRDSEP